MDLQEVCWGHGLIDLSQNRDRQLSLVKAVMTLRVTQNARNFLTSLEPVGFSGRTLLYGVFIYVNFYVNPKTMVFSSLKLCSFLHIDKKKFELTCCPYLQDTNRTVVYVTPFIFLICKVILACQFKIPLLFSIALHRENWIRISSENKQAVPM